MNTWFSEGTHSWNTTVKPLEAVTDLYSVSMKLAQSAILRSRERIQEPRDQSENQKTYSEKFVVKKVLNVWTVIMQCNCNRDVQWIQSSNLEPTIISHATPYTWQYNSDLNIMRVLFVSIFWRWIRNRSSFGKCGRRLSWLSHFSLHTEFQISLISEIAIPIISRCFFTPNVTEDL
jgi:hypothetical protein